MNVIPFRPRQVIEPLAFAIGARVDLRVGVLAAGVIRARGDARESFEYSSLARLLRGARMAWRERGLHAPLTLAVPGEIHNEMDADFLHEAATEAGYTRHTIVFELCERQLVADTHLAEELRARGWSIALRGDADCPLPFGVRARALYCELVLSAPETPDPFLAIEDGDRSPLGRRLLAAKAAELTVTADIVRTAAQARMLAIAGFDRGGGPFAEAGLR